jgi:hypothetical protein
MGSKGLNLISSFEDSFDKLRKQEMNPGLNERLA